MHKQGQKEFKKDKHYVLEWSQNSCRNFEIHFEVLRGGKLLKVRLLKVSGISRLRTLPLFITISGEEN